MGVSPYPRCFEKKNTTDSKKAHFITLENGVRGVLIENTTDFQKFRGVSKFRDVSKSKLNYQDITNDEESRNTL